MLFIWNYFSCTRKHCNSDKNHMTTFKYKFVLSSSYNLPTNGTTSNLFKFSPKINIHKMSLVHFPDALSNSLHVSSLKLCISACLFHPRIYITERHHVVYILYAIEIIILIIIIILKVKLKLISTKIYFSFPAHIPVGHMWLDFVCTHTYILRM